MEWLADMFNVDHFFASSLFLGMCGTLLVLGSCVVRNLVRFGRSANGSSCRPDKRFEGRAKAKITSLRVYPVKSCAGHEVERAALGGRGLEMDRLWLVVDGRGRFMSQRRCPKMALITPSRPVTKDEPLVLSAPGMDSLEVPVMHKVGPDGPEAGGETVVVGIWSDTCEAVDQGNAVAAWLRAFLELDNLRLVRMKDGFVRPTDPGYGIGFNAGFANQFPMLLAAEESLEELNSRMTEDEVIGMDRFRPNIVVRGWGPFAEDNWTKIRAGGITMRTPKPCNRCQVPSINQTTLEKRQEPRSTMDKFRAGSHVAGWKDSWAKEVFFGMNVLHEGRGMLHVGDEVDVLRVAKKGSSGRKTD